MKQKTRDALIFMTVNLIGLIAGVGVAVWLGIKLLNAIPMP